MGLHAGWHFQRKKEMGVLFTCFMNIKHTTNYVFHKVKKSFITTVHVKATGSTFFGSWKFRAS